MGIYKQQEMKRKEKEDDDEGRNACAWVACSGGGCGGEEYNPPLPIGTYAPDHPRHGDVTALRCSRVMNLLAWEFSDRNRAPRAQWGLANLLALEFDSCPLCAATLFERFHLRGSGVQRWRKRVIFRGKGKFLKKMEFCESDVEFWFSDPENYGKELNLAKL